VLREHREQFQEHERRMERLSQRPSRPSRTLAGADAPAARRGQDLAVHEEMPGRVHSRSIVSR